MTQSLMAEKFEASAFETLVAEQEIVQAGKFQGRLLEEYGRYIFPGQDWLEPLSSVVTDFLRPICVGERVSLDGVIRGLCEASGDNPVRWVDMGGGRGLPMRQLAADTERRESLAMINVDLFDYGLEGLQPDEVAYLEDLVPGMTHELAAPSLMQADVETVSLPEPADLITSVEVMQYLNNPLASISNWYNQLADNGLLVISTEHEWASWIRYQREPVQSDLGETPTKHFLEALERSGIRFAASYESDWPNGLRPKHDPSRIRNLVIQKTPSTQLVINSPVTEIWVNPYNYKAVYYEEPGPYTRPIVEVMPPRLAAQTSTTHILNRALF